MLGDVAQTLVALATVTQRLLDGTAGEVERETAMAIVRRVLPRPT